MPAIDTLYVKWNEEDASLAGILTNKQTKQRNADLRLKLEVWKSRKRINERKATKNRNFEQGKEIRDFLNNELDDHK